MTSTTIQCLFALRAERRANDLTIEALVREIAASTQATFLMLAQSYVAYTKRQARRRHHYRRALQSLPYPPRTVVAASDFAAEAVSEYAGEPKHVVAAPVKRQTKAPVIQLTEHRSHNAVAQAERRSGDAPVAPKAHICEFAAKRDRNVTA